MASFEAYEHVTLAKYLSSEMGIDLETLQEGLVNVNKHASSTWTMTFDYEVS